MLQECQHPFVADRVEVASNVRIEDPADLLETYPYRQNIEGLMGLTSRPEAVREAEEVHLVDGVEHFGNGPLDDLVFQSRYTQRPLSAVTLGYVCSS